jgi:hypothetical protein
MIKNLSADLITTAACLSPAAKPEAGMCAVGGVLRRPDQADAFDRLASALGASFTQNKDHELPQLKYLQQSMPT